MRILEVCSTGGHNWWIHQTSLGCLSRRCRILLIVVSWRSTTILLLDHVIWTILLVVIIWNLSLARVLDDTASMICTSRCWTRNVVLSHRCSMMLKLRGFILAWVNRIDSGVRSSCLLGILLGCLLLAALTLILLITRILFEWLSLLVIDLWITISWHNRWLLP